jgi:hypothetical protein
MGKIAGPRDPEVAKQNAVLAPAELLARAFSSAAQVAKRRSMVTAPACPKCHENKYVTRRGVSFPSGRNSRPFDRDRLKPAPVEFFSALIDGDESMTNSILVILTLMAIDIGLSFWKQASARADRVIDSLPLVIVEDGRPFEDRMQKSRIDLADVLTAARMLHGLSRLEQIKYAVLERSGQITVIPAE